MCFIKVDRWPSAGFLLDRGLMSGKIVENRRNPVNSNAGLQTTTVSSIDFFAAFVFCIGFVIIKLKIEGQTIYRKPHAAKLQNRQNSTLSWVSLIRLQELRF